MTTVSAQPASFPRPFFLPSRPGKLFAVHHLPADEHAHWGNLLVVPAFNEEMNRCRSMVTLLGQRLGGLGVGTLVLDLYGTGDSAGEHGDASWELWRDNVHQGIDWLDGQAGACIGVLGIRLGFALAVDALRDEPHERALIAWQPVVDGKSYFTQFMRAKIAANMDRTDIPRETTADMRARLAAGQGIEVAGYAIRPELAGPIDRLQLGELIPSATAPIVWFEKGAEPTGGISPASQKTLDAWQQAGRTASTATFDGPAFWSLYERAVSPDLIEKTADWVGKLRTAS